MGAVRFQLQMSGAPAKSCYAQRELVVSMRTKVAPPGFANRKAITHHDVTAEERQNGGCWHNPTVEWGLACFALLILVTNFKYPCRVNQHKVSISADSE